jgi:L-alanine-DL-glutamate epimerase-like enolase superfamily enzyme
MGPAAARVAAARDRIDEDFILRVDGIKRTNRSFPL